jgi:hypothetical protein
MATSVHRVEDECLHNAWEGSVLARGMGLRSWEREMSSDARKASSRALYFPLNFPDVCAASLTLPPGAHPPPSFYLGSPLGSCVTKPMAPLRRVWILISETSPLLPPLQCRRQLRSSLSVADSRNLWSALKVIPLVVTGRGPVTFFYMSSALGKASGVNTLSTGTDSKQETKSTQ